MLLESECLFYYIQSYAVHMCDSTVFSHMTLLFLFNYVPAVPVIIDKVGYYVLGLIKCFSLFAFVPCVTYYQGTLEIYITHPPFALCKVFLNLTADGFMDVLGKCSISSYPNGRKKTILKLMVCQTERTKMVINWDYRGYYRHCSYVSVTQLIITWLYIIIWRNMK